MRFLRNIILGVANKVMPVSPLVEALVFELKNNPTAFGMRVPENPGVPYLLCAGANPHEGIAYNPFLFHQGVSVRFELPGWEMAIDTYYFDAIEVNFRERRLLAETILTWADRQGIQWVL